MTGLPVKVLQYLNDTYNKIVIPILEPQTFYERMMMDWKVAKDATEMRQMAKASTEKLAEELCALRSKMYFESRHLERSSLSKISSKYLQIACRHLSVQSATEAMCNLAYRTKDDDVKGALAETGVYYEDDVDNESDCDPQEQYFDTYDYYLSYNRDFFNDCEWYADEDRVEHLEDVPALDSLSSAQESSAASSTPSNIQEQLSPETRTSTVDGTIIWEEVDFEYFDEA
ncbi:hypothetical protein E4U55_004783 [Claviceps digitariae]|nr:hypothetical protein E4U55_004783 [Claviceps digitariae]